MWIYLHNYSRTHPPLLDFDAQYIFIYTTLHCQTSQMFSRKTSEELQLFEQWLFQDDKKQTQLKSIQQLKRFLQITNNAAAVLAWSLTLSGSEVTNAAQEGAVIGITQEDDDCAAFSKVGADQRQSPNAHRCYRQKRNFEKWSFILQGIKRWKSSGLYEPVSLPQLICRSAGPSQVHQSLISIGAQIATRHQWAPITLIDITAYFSCSPWQVRPQVSPANKGTCCILSFIHPLTLLHLTNSQTLTARTAQTLMGWQKSHLLRWVMTPPSHHVKPKPIFAQRKCNQCSSQGLALTGANTTLSHSCHDTVRGATSQRSLDISLFL